MGLAGCDRVRGWRGHHTVGTACGVIPGVIRDQTDVHIYILTPQPICTGPKSDFSFPVLDRQVFHPLPDLLSASPEHGDNGI